MGKFSKAGGREMPELNTSSLPDLVFAFLFFIMMVTSMREVTLKVQFKAPQATELQKLEKKSNADLQWKYGRNIYGESIRDVIHTVIAVIVDMKQPKTLITALNVAIVFKSVFLRRKKRNHYHGAIVLENRNCLLR